MLHAQGKAGGKAAANGGPLASKARARLFQGPGDEDEDDDDDEDDEEDDEDDEEEAVSLNSPSHALLLLLHT